MAVDALALSARFGLGDVVSEPRLAAAGWGGRNHVWQVETLSGVFAVKDVVEELLPADHVAPVRIEERAFVGGVPCPEPVPSTTGAWFEEVEGRWYRCHRWASGSAKNNEGTTPEEALRMGQVVAALHALRIPVDTSPERHGFGKEHWLDLANRGLATAGWPDLIRQHLGSILDAEAIGSSFPEELEVGSHCDLNAHNVLFSDDRLQLVDWDAAGPISARYEAVATATLWAQRHDGRLDTEIAQSFLWGYLSAGGEIGPDDSTIIGRRLNGLTWWTERNVQIAIAQRSPTDDDLASGLVVALANGPADVDQRQAFLRDAFATL